MAYSSRLWRYLPGFLKRAPQLDADGNSSIVWSLCQAVGAACDDVLASLELLKARACAGRYWSGGPFDAYYASASRPVDIARLAASRGLYQRSAESDAQFEARVLAFPSEVQVWGTTAALERELGRLGFAVDLDLSVSRDRWRLLDTPELCAISECNRSHIFDPSDPSQISDSAVRGTRLFDDGEERWMFILRLSGQSSFSQSEVEETVRVLKPAPVRCYAFLPGFEHALPVN